MTLKAYRIFCEAIDGSEGGISFGENAGKARYKAYLSARDAFPEIGLTKFRAIRAPEYDNMGSREQRQYGCWLEEFIDAGETL